MEYNFDKKLKEILTKDTELPNEYKMNIKQTLNNLDNKSKVKQFPKFRAILSVAAVAAIGIIGVSTYMTLPKEIEKINPNSDEEIKEIKEEYIVRTNNLSNFDLSFLKLENSKENKVYSPLSIKYALKMLEDGTTGTSYNQINSLIGEYPFTKYTSNEHMALANSVFIKDNFKGDVKEEYINTLKKKYNAEVNYDSFKNANSINEWVSDKTLNLINDMSSDISPDINLLLINALGIDMDWEEKFLTNSNEMCTYSHEIYGLDYANIVTSKKFDNEKQTVAGMEIAASLNNYDIVNELGEENIRKTVKEAFIEWANNLQDFEWEVEHMFNNDMSAENIEKKADEYLETYIPEIDSNYHRVDYFSGFSLYVDDDVKVFAKDLKEYNGTTLQYVGIMPINESLDTYIENTDAIQINTVISNLKTLKSENFKEGVVTRITGFIPKFNFEYELDLKNDLQKMGITEVFKEGKANLTNICDDNSIYVEDAVHKANIEFTQDGIKAAAATRVYAGGAGEPFNYYYDIPVEEIDLTFDKPYLFFIRNKETGEIWFTGTVYKPLQWENEPTKDMDLGGKA